MANMVPKDTSGASAPFRILSISDDDGLRHSRELLLQSEGYETESMSSNAVLSVSHVRSFDAALICRSVDTKRGMALSEMLQRYHPEMQIMCIPPLESAEQFDVTLRIVAEPQLFLEAVRRMRIAATARKTYEAAR